MLLVIRRRWPSCCGIPSPRGPGDPAADPALQSYWMKVHVPANFIGYGAFALAAMIGVADLLVRKGILASRLPAPKCSTT